MFDNLNTRLQQITEKVRGRGRLSEDNVRDVVRDVRRALLEADVALEVARDFVERVRLRAIGQEVLRSLSPGQVFVKILHEELTAALGGPADGLNLRCQPPAVILLAGLQGAGKTTTAAKLALLLKEKESRRVMLASLDTRRPAAMLQLQQLAARIDVPFVDASDTTPPVEIAAQAIDAARKNLVDVLILDTAGRTRLESDLLDEVMQIQNLSTPAETLFVVDSMAGQDAVQAARAFGAALNLTGVILTKVDGDARGGAAFSVKSVTGVPIKFIGTGEGIEALEAFHPDRMASRILGMGDVLSLVEEVEQKVDRQQAERLAKKLKKGRGFDLDDLRGQLEQMQNMGGLSSMLDKLPMPGKVDPAALAKGFDDQAVRLPGGDH